MNASPLATPFPPPFGHALVIDDHPLFCDALALTLRGLMGVDRVETAHTLTTALAWIEGGTLPDIVLLDLDLPDVEGLEGLLRLRAAAPEVPVLVVTSMTDPRLIEAALAAGAAGFVPKHSGREAFRAAFHTLAEGRRHLPEGYEDPTGTTDPAADALGRLAQLTRQQGRILDLLCQGRLNKQIAWELAIAETTVKAHVTAIMRKLGVQSRTQAVLLAQQARFATLLPER
jgi:DNA-binding NarL/FixJ family response regulator